MNITASPSWADLPVYNADDQNATGFPAAAMSSPTRSAPPTA